MEEEEIADKMELLGKSLEELRTFCVELGEPAYRGDQVYRALYAERNFDLASISNLPTALRQKVLQDTTITLPTVKQRYHSQDGSVRYLLGLEGGSREEPRARKPASVEAVFMPSENRQTICISTQAGCAVDCQFCMTAQLGLIRNLTPGEILAQVLLPLTEHKDTLTPQTNVVLMGQGEPLLNYDNVMAAMRILLDQVGIGLAPKHVTLSTSGIVPGIEKLGQEARRPKLAISLNASNDAQRDVLMPINKKWPIDELISACREFEKSLKRNERFTFEYVMLDGVNDSDEHARQLANLINRHKLHAKVNLIPHNPAEPLPYQPSSVERVESFRQILEAKGVHAFVRRPRGRDILAACGQLAARGTPLVRKPSLEGVPVVARASCA